MFSLIGLVLLVIFDYLRPQEFFPFLASLPLLYLFTGLAVIGFVIDMRLGLTRVTAAPHLVVVLLWYLWQIITVAVMAPHTLLSRIIGLAIPILVYFLIGHSIKTFRMYQILLGTMLAMSLFLAFVGVHQGLSTWGCHRLVYAHGDLVPVYDGRDCDNGDRKTCEREGAEPNADYWCEKIGLFGTSSVTGRVRWLGTLQDPNELALTLGAAVPFAFAFLDRRRSLFRMLVFAATCGLVGLCAVYTGSRGGQLVFLGVLGTYFIRKYGKKGLMLGVLFALPIMAFGGREGGEESTKERTECWHVGLHLFLQRPVFGVGSGQFGEYHFLTAHNSYVLSIAETGAIGLLLFTAVLYISIKIPITALRRGRSSSRDGPVPAPIAQSWSTALLATNVGMLVGILFLSFCYKEILWIFIGLSGALYQAIKRHDPSFVVRFGWRDLALLAAIDASVIGSLLVYTTLKVG